MRAPPLGPCSALRRDLSTEAVHQQTLARQMGLGGGPCGAERVEQDPEGPPPEESEQEGSFVIAPLAALAGLSSLASSVALAGPSASDDLVPRGPGEPTVTRSGQAAAAAGDGRGSLRTARGAPSDVSDDTCTPNDDCTEAGESSTDHVATDNDAEQLWESQDSSDDGFDVDAVPIDDTLTLDGRTVWKHMRLGTYHLGKYAGDTEINVTCGKPKDGMVEATAEQAAIGSCCLRCFSRL